MYSRSVSGEAGFSGGSTTSCPFRIMEIERLEAVLEMSCWVVIVSCLLSIKMKKANE